MRENVITHPENHEPTEFTLAMLDWLPWLAPPTEDALTERQRTSPSPRAPPGADPAARTADIAHGRDEEHRYTHGE